MYRLMLRDFYKWFKKSGLSQSDLNIAIDEMQRGLVGDCLGAFVYKKRIARVRSGKSGGARTIIVYRKDKIILFIYGYFKNEKADLLLTEEEALRIFAKSIMKQTDYDWREAINNGFLVQMGD